VGHRPLQYEEPAYISGDNNDEENARHHAEDNLIIQEEQQNGRAISVNSLSLKHFRSMLIEHFNVAFHKQMVVWPTRLRTRPRDVSF
jgi:hypothetical protein